MNWEALGAIGEIVGAIAVIATLGYVALQIRQNTRSMRASTSSAAATAARDFSGAIARDAELANLYETGLRSLDSLNPSQRAQFDQLLITLFSHYEDLYYQQRDGSVHADIWEGRVEAMLRLLSQPGCARWFEGRKVLWGKGFREFIERELASGALPERQSLFDS